MLGVPLFHVERSAETIQFYFDCRGPWPAVLPPDVSSPNMVLFEDGRTGRMDAQKSPSQEKNCMCVCVSTLVPKGAACLFLSTLQAGGLPDS